MRHAIWYVSPVAFDHAVSFISANADSFISAPFRSVAIGLFGAGLVRTRRSPETELFKARPCDLGIELPGFRHSPRHPMGWVRETHLIKIQYNAGMAEPSEERRRRALGCLIASEPREPVYGRLRGEEQLP